MPTEQEKQIAEAEAILGDRLEERSFVKGLFFGEFLPAALPRYPHLGADSATADLVAKLRDYCLNPAHPRGRHKARLFASVLNLTQEDAEFLREHLLGAALDGNAIPTLRDEFGQRYQIDSELTRGRRATIRSAWIVLRGERIPRLTTCFVLLG